MKSWWNPISSPFLEVFDPSPLVGELPQYEQAARMAAETYGINVPENPVVWLLEGRNHGETMGLCLRTLSETHEQHLFLCFMLWISLFLFFGDHRYLNVSFLKRGIPQELGSRKVFGKRTKGSTGDVWQTNMNQPYGTCWVWFIGMITTYKIGYDMLIMHQQTIIFWISCDEQCLKRKKMGRKMEETSKEHWKTSNTSRKPRHVDSAIPKAVLLHCSCRLLFFPRFFWIYVTACNDMFVFMM